MAQDPEKIVIEAGCLSATGCLGIVLFFAAVGVVALAATVIRLLGL